LHKIKIYFLEKIEKIDIFFSNSVQKYKKILIYARIFVILCRFLKKK